MTQKRVITIFLDGDGWMSRDNDPLELELFGTDTLPLPFLKDTPAEMVKSVLERLNPLAEVVVQ